MRRRRAVKRVLLATGAGLLLTAVVAGVAFAGGGGISSSETIKLRAVPCGEAETHCRFFRLRENAEPTGAVETFNVPILDEDADVVGRNRAECIFAKSVGHQCTLTETLRAGEHTRPGTVVLSGLFHPDKLEPGGYVDTFAVIGGSGAYENVRGEATFGFNGTYYPINLYLIP
jgi:hypothetical protein